MPQRFGRYEIKNPLSTGGMAEVYLAVQRGAGDFEKQVAVKVLLPELEEDPALVERFLYEARLAAGLTHPNICQVFDAGEEHGRHYMVLEYLPGQTLGRIIRRGVRVGQRLSPQLAAYCVARAAEALAYAHERRGPDGKPLAIVHRDVSPGNVMVTYEGQVKLLDFGIARAVDRKFRTRTGELRGKLSYMSPEQISEAEADARSDLFALGVVLYECLTGTHPFEAETDLETLRAVLERPIPELPASVPARLKQVVEQALQRDPDARPQQARDLAAQLDEVAGAAGPEGLRAYMHEVFERERADELARAEQKRTVPVADRRSRAPVLAAGAVAAAAVAGAAIWAATRPPAFVPPAISIVTPAPVAPAVPTAQPTLAAVAEPEPASRPAPGRPKRHAPPPKVGDGTLSLDTSPWTDVYFQGRKLGTTPIFEVALPAGKQKLRVVNREAKIDRTVEITIVDGALTTRKVSW
ncbi:MAG: protein kinase [Archangiaceae bacterium]|nr:protein kinase [Archangiaceae bacterium]